MTTWMDPEHDLRGRARYGKVGSVVMGRGAAPQGRNRLKTVPQFVGTW